MKKCTLFLLVLITVPFAFALPMREWHLLYSLDYFEEDVNALTPEDFGVGVGIGAKFNNTFGLELTLNVSKPIEPLALLEKLAESVGYSVDAVAGYRLTTKGNQILSMASTIAFSMTDKMKAVIKAGVSTVKYEVVQADITVPELIEVFNKRTGETAYDLRYRDYDLSSKGYDHGLVLSSGLIFKVYKKHSLELCISQSSFDIGTSRNIYAAWRWEF